MRYKTFLLNNYMYLHYKLNLIFEVIDNVKPKNDILNILKHERKVII